MFLDSTSNPFKDIYRCQGGSVFVDFLFVGLNVSKDCKNSNTPHNNINFFSNSLVFVQHRTRLMLGMF